MQQTVLVPEQRVGVKPFPAVSARYFIGEPQPIGADDMIFGGVPNQKVLAVFIEAIQIRALP